MSKRYGRNQKRRHKERIAILEKENKYLSELGARNRQIVEDTADVLGRYFVTLPPETQELRYLDSLYSGWRVPVLKDVSFSCVSESFAPSPAEVCEIMMPIIHGSSIKDELRKQMHLRFEYAGRKVGYGITEEAVHFSSSNRLAQRIAHEISDEIVRAIK